MSQAIPKVSLRDNVVYNLAHVLPYFLQGVFTRNKFWVGLWSRMHPDPLAARFGAYLREKYQSEYLYISMAGTKTLIVMDQAGIRRVLDNSPMIYAESRLKRLGMAHFQPNALTISRGEEWKDRRRFNEAVLYGDQDLHQHAGTFLEVIRHEVTARKQYAGREIAWDDFQELFEKIMLQVIFGKAAREDQALWGHLKAMLRESNRVFGLKQSKHFEPFYARVRAYLGSPQPASLASVCSHAPATPVTSVENQLPHWMFAMNETLATNTARAMALLATHPEAEARVRAEMAEADLGTAEGVAGLAYLEGCIQEAMRLWPTTPMLVRETVSEDTLAGEQIPPKTQVVVLSSFNHRDTATYPFADTFSPEVWLNGAVNYHFNHLSNGTQVCVGKGLALFIAKSVVATLLNGSRYTLQQPALNPRKPMPYKLNYYDIKLTREPVA